MNREELNDLLEQVAANDLAEGADIFDHPCSVAIRAINQAFEDIEKLRKVAPRRKGSKAIQMLTGLRYNPTW